MAKQQTGPKDNKNAKEFTTLVSQMQASMSKLDTLTSHLLGTFNNLGGKIRRTVSEDLPKWRQNLEGVKNLSEDLNDDIKDYNKSQDVKNKILAYGYSQQVAELEVARDLALAHAKRYNMTKEHIAEINKEYDKTVAIAKKHDKIVEKQKAEQEAAEKTKEIEEKRHEALEKIGVNTGLIKNFLQGGVARTLAMTIAAEKMGEAFGEAYKELKEEGLSATQAAHESMSSFTDSIRTGFIASAKDIREARKAIMETGGSLHDAEEAGKGAAVMAELYGGSVANAGKAIGNLQKIPGIMKDSVQSTAEFGAKLAMAADVPADTVTQALATNMDAAAKAGPNMTKSFALAAVNAKKIGVEFSTITGLADKLLDFESSINAQMEASVLLGKELNLDKAREAALAGDYATVQKEILKQVGSEAEFTKMNALQKQKLAEAMGVSVGDLAKMVRGQGELADGTKIEEANRDKSSKAMEVLYNFGAKHAGSLAAMVPSLIQMVMQMRMMQMMSKMSGGSGGFFGSLFGKGGSKTPAVPTPPAIPKTDAMADAGKKMSGGGMMAGFKKNMKALAEGFKAMGQPGVGKGVFNTFVAGPALIVGLGALPFLFIFSKMDLKKVDTNFTKLATGLRAMSSTFVGSLALGAFAIASIPGILGLGFLALFSKMDLGGIDKKFTKLAIGLNAMSSTFVGSLALGAFAVAGALAIPSLIFLGGIALIGKGAEIGLKALGKGLAAFGNPATALFVLTGIGLIAALGVAMIPFAYALSLVTPLVEALGNMIVNVLAAVPPIITAIANGFVTMFTTISDNIGSLLALGPALMMIGAGLGVMSLAGIGALPIIGALAALAVVAPALSGLGASLGGMFGGGGEEKEDKMDALLAKIDRLIGVAEKGGIINMDGKKVGEVVRLSINSSGIR